jgi:uncharacterized protein YqeY
MRAGVVAVPGRADAPPAAEPWRERFRSRLAEALRGRDEVRTAAFRSVLGTLDNATAVPADPGRPGVGGGPIAGAAAGAGSTEAPRRSLAAREIRALIAGEIAEREAAARSYDAAGAGSRAERLRAEAAAIREALEGS